MAANSKDDLAKALEAMASGGQPSAETPADPAHPEPMSEPAIAPERRPATPPAATVPGRPARPATPLSTPVPSAQPLSQVLAVQRARKQLGVLRTAIPPLLTMGVMLVLAAVASIIAGEDSLLGDQLALPITMILLGLVLLGAAVLTMVHVRRLLSQAP